MVDILGSNASLESNAFYRRSGSSSRSGGGYRSRGSSSYGGGYRSRGSSSYGGSSHRTSSTSASGPTSSYSTGSSSTSTGSGSNMMNYTLIGWMFGRSGRSHHHHSHSSYGSSQGDFSSSSYHRVSRDVSSLEIIGRVTLVAGTASLLGYGTYRGCVAAKPYVQDGVAKIQERCKDIELPALPEVRKITQREKVLLTLGAFCALAAFAPASKQCKLF